MAHWVTLRAAIRHIPVRDSDALAWLRRHGLVCRIDTGKKTREVVDLNAVDAVIREKHQPQRPRRYATGTSGGALSWDDL